MQSRRGCRRRGIALRWAIVCVAAAAAAVAAVTPVSAAAPSFPDLENHWARPEISYLAARGYASGYPDETFRPLRPVTRAEFTKMLVVALGEGRQAAELVAVGSPFADVGAGHWASGFINVAWEFGLVQGYPGGQFQPAREIRRDELAAMVVRALAAAGDTSAAPVDAAAYLSGRFTDADDIPAWARQPVARAVQSGLMEGFPDESFRPDTATTRAVAAVLNARLLERQGRLFDAGGVAVSIEAGATRLTMRPYGGSEAWILPVTEDPLVFHNGQAGGLGVIRPGDEVFPVIGSSGTVLAVSARYRWQAGIIEQVPSSKRFRLVSAAGSEFDVQVAADAAVYRGGDAASAAAIAPGEHADVVFNSVTGEARRVWVSRYNRRGRVTETVGQPQSQGGSGRVVRVQLQSGDVRELREQEVSHVWVNGRRTRLTHIRVGDRLYLGTDGTTILFVDAHRGGDSS